MNFPNTLSKNISSLSFQGNTSQETNIGNNTK